MKIYEAPHMNFGELPRSSPGSTRSSPGSAGKRREASAAPDSVGNCGNKLKYQFGCQRYISTILNTFSIIYDSLER